MSFPNATGTVLALVLEHGHAFFVPLIFVLTVSISDFILNFQFLKQVFINLTH